MIKYCLSKNKLSTSDIAPYLARTITNGTLTWEQFIQDIAYGSTATLADVKAVLENIERVCIKNLSQGRSVNLGMFIIRPQVKGYFHSIDENFTQEKNWIQLSIIPSSNFQKKVTQNAKTQKISQRKKKLPMIYSFENHSTDNPNSISVSDLVSIRGENLKFDKANQDLGVFLKSKNEIIRVVEYSQITSKKVSFKVPTGLQTTSSYNLKVKSMFGQDLREGEFDSTLRVGNPN
jgi:hypothetical protein